MSHESRINAYEASIVDAERYIKRANAAIAHLKADGLTKYQSKRNAAAKRASMELSNSLVEVRRVL